MNELLVQWFENNGISSEWVQLCALIAGMLIIFILMVLVHYVAKHQLLFLANKWASKSSNTFDDQLIDHKVFSRIASLVPSIFIVFLLPYLLPIGEKFLLALGERYSEKCDAAGIKYVPFVVTSLTRSTKSVKKLRRGNRNAIENSAHLKGKTLDISYRKFENNQKQLNLFVDALYELKQEGWCFVKYERTGCLHITAR